MLDLLFRESRWPLLAMSAFVPVVGWLLWSHVPDGALLTWCAVMVLALMQAAVMMGHRRLHTVPRPTSYWIGRFRLATVLGGIGWGGLALLYPLADGEPARMLIVITLLAVPTGVVTVLSTQRELAQTFGLCCLLPLAATLAWQPDAGHQLLALAVLSFLVLVPFLVPHRVHAAVRQVHADTLERDAALRRLEAAEAVAGVGHFEWSRDDPALLVSAQLRRMLGFKRDDTLERSDLWHGLVSAERQRLRDLLREARAQRLQTFAYEVSPQGLGPVTDLHVVHRVQYDAEGRVTHGLTTVQDISARKAYQRELQALAFHDPLTGLVNRNRFQERLARCVEEAGAENALALLMIDLDHFKSVNDTLGHAMGDRLLVAAAERLRTCVRSVDTVARLGGDEFAIIAPALSSGIAAAELAASVIQALSLPFQLDEQEVYVSSSIGIALYPEDAPTADLLLSCADMALFEAKGQGRACFQFHTAEQGALARERVALEADLRRALERGEFELHFQPKVDIATGEVVGAEALLRWRHRERGMVPPDRFIRIAEDSGLIVPIGEWVLRQACEAASAWNAGRSAEQVPIKIAVNLSPRQFWAPNLLTMVCEAMVQSGCRPEWIELEITESLLLDSRGEVAEVLVDLREMGFTLAIDDFGTGYSALGYLTRFPIGTLKIDRTFISGMAGDPQREAIVRAIVSLGHSLQLALVAEGVETMEQAELLRGMGCGLAQGWLYGRPVPRGAFEAGPLQRQCDPMMATAAATDPPRGP